MATAYVFDLDGYAFPRNDVPARGPFEEFNPVRWSTFEVLGEANPGDIKTFIGYRSQSWPCRSVCIEATKDKLIAVNNAHLAVLLKTPQNGTGFNVIVEDLRIEHMVAAPAESSSVPRWDATWTFTRR